MDLNNLILLVFQDIFKQVIFIKKNDSLLIVLGDAGIIDDDGYVYILSRTDDSK